MSIQTRGLSDGDRNTDLTRRRVDRFADEHQWKSGEYEVYIAPNEDWGRYFLAVASSHINTEEESAFDKQLYAFLKKAVSEWPRLCNSIDLDVLSLNGRSGLIDSH